MTRPKIGACSLLCDGGPEVGLWIRYDGQHIHLDLTIESARRLARELERAATEACEWLEKNRRYAVVEVQK